MDPIGLLDRLGYLGRRRADVVGLLADGLVQRLSVDARVLDFGAGSGRVSIPLSEKVPLRFTLVDPDANALASVPAGWPTAVLEPGRPLPFESGHFQAAFAVDVLHHVPDALASLAELRRVLAPGGWLWIVEYDLRRWMVRLMGLVCRWRRMQRHLLAPAELDRLLGEAGFAGSVSRLDALRVLAVAQA
jgi:SAM-dependent methyltransferase